MSAAAAFEGPRGWVQGLRYGLMGFPLAFVALPLYVLWPHHMAAEWGVPISSALRSYLEACQPADGSVWFFPSSTGKRWDPDNFSQNLREVNEAHGLPWGCLDFRHTFGSHLAQKGESLYKIAELMGNSPEICRRHYAALIPELMRDTVEFMAPPPQA